MNQMTFLGKLNIYVVINSLIRYQCMLISPIFSVMPFPRFWKINKINSFLSTFPVFGKTNICFHFLKHSFLSNHTTNLRKTKFVLSQKGNLNLSFFLFKLIKYLISYSFSKSNHSNAPFFPVRGSICLKFIISCSRPMLLALNLPHLANKLHTYTFGFASTLK